MADIYATRYGIGLQDVLYGRNYLPDNEIMLWIQQLVYWIHWYEYVSESSSYYDDKCPDSVKDEPVLYNQWLTAQKQKGKTTGSYGSN